MKGFSLFAPVIGMLMLAIALGVTAMFSQSEMRMMKTIEDKIKQASSFSLTEALKNDMISTFSVGLRNYFTNAFYKYRPNEQPKTDELTNWLKSEMNSIKGEITVGGRNIRIDFLNENKWGNIAGKIKWSEKVVGDASTRVYIISASADLSNVDMPEFKVTESVKTGNSTYNESTTTYVLPQATVTFTAFLPGSLQSDLQTLKAELETYMPIKYGFCKEGSTDPVFYFGLVEKEWGESWKKEKPEDPCYTKYGKVWADTENEGKIKLTEKLNDLIPDWEITSVKVNSETGSEIPFKRLLCIASPLTNVFEGLKDLLCQEVKYNTKPKCYTVTEITVTAEREYTNPCGGDPITVVAEVTVSGKSSGNLNGNIEESSNGIKDDIKIYGSCEEEPCKNGGCCGCINSPCPDNGVTYCENHLIYDATYFINAGVCGNVATTSKRCVCGDCSCETTINMTQLWSNIKDKISNILGSIDCTQEIIYTNIQTDCETFKSTTLDNFLYEYTVKGLGILSATIVKGDGSLEGKCTVSLQ